MYHIQFVFLAEFQKFLNIEVNRVKDKRVNIRISEKDLLDLQKRAIRQGIPYQTLLSSVLHKYASGTLTEK